MKLGICVPHYGRTIEVDRMLAVVRHAEEAGLAFERDRQERPAPIAGASRALDLRALALARHPDARSFRHPCRDPHLDVAMLAVLVDPEPLDAALRGRFEVELEQRGVQIADLTVEP